MGKLFQCYALAGAVTFLALAGICPAADVGWKALPGHVPREVAALKASGQLPATRPLRLAIGVPLRDPAGLEHFLAQIYDPASPNFRKYLTPEEFTARFGPTAQDYEAVKQLVRANGLVITATYSNRLVLDVTGPAAAVEKMLHIKFRTYPHPTEARHFFAPDTEPTVKASAPIADIQGLSDLHRPHPKLKRGKAVSANNGSGSGGAFLGDDFRNAYAAGTTLTGAGQMVGLLQFDGFYSSDIARYARTAGGGRTNIAIQTVLLDGFNGVPTGMGDDEVALDIEMAMAMAPGLSKIVVFEAGPDGFQNDVLNAMAANSTVKNLSCSWGWNGGPSTTTDNIFKQLAAQGQSFFNASGDSDAFTVGANSVNGVDNTSTANAPSSCPYITQVGGTTLTMSGTGASFTSETVWNWGGGTGSSGGISSSYSIPSWQTGVSTLASTTQRNIPDVAMTADNCYVISGNGSANVFGGTSCAAPLWAGFMALVNQQAAGLGNPPPGLINAAIYAIGKGQNASYSYASCFHDTITGNSFWSSSPASYSGSAGYDLCTGWGTPAANLIAALAGSGSGTIITPQASLGVSPLTGFAASGAVGGPFTPASGSFQLTNPSASALKWSLTGVPAWLKVDATNGALATSARLALNVTVTPGANSLKVGNYSGSLTFSDLTSHVSQKIPVALQVVSPLPVTPTNAFAAIGPPGGPFTPKSQTFVISNLSRSTQKWSVAKTAAWLTVSATGGSLAAGNRTNVTVSLASSANTLKPGIYRASVTFSNSAGSLAVPVSLSVGQPLVQNGGFEAGGFSGWTHSGNTAYTTVAAGAAGSSYVHGGSHGVQAGSSGAPGYLSQTVPTAPGQSYLLSLWLRNATGRMPNWFQIQWEGATVFEQSNLATTSWTNLQFVVTASTAAALLQLGFQDDPYYLGIDDVSLTAVAGASARSAIAAARNFQVKWNTTPGSVYQAQYKTNLQQSDWVNLGGVVTAETNSLMITDTNAFQYSPQRFYRLQELP